MATTCDIRITPAYVCDITYSVSSANDITFTQTNLLQGATLKEWYYISPTGVRSPKYTSLRTITNAEDGEYLVYFTYQNASVDCDVSVTPLIAATITETIHMQQRYISFEVEGVISGYKFSYWYYVKPDGTRSTDFTAITSIPITQSGTYRAYFFYIKPAEVDCDITVTPSSSASVDFMYTQSSNEISLVYLSEDPLATFQHYYYITPSGQRSSNITNKFTKIYVKEIGTYQIYVSYEQRYAPTCKVHINPTNVATVDVNIDVQDEEIIFTQTYKSNLFDFSDWYYVTPSGVESQRFGSFGRINITEDGEYNAYFNYVRNSNPDVPLPDIPTDVIIDTKPFGWLNHGETGMYRIFVPTLTQLQNIGNWLYSSTFKDAIEAFLTKDLLNLNIADIVMNFCVYPFVVQPTGTAHLKYGWISASVGTTPIDVNYTVQNYYQYNCGTITIPEYYQSAIDYETTAQIYLPFIGVKPLETYDAIGKSINPIYQFDLLTGDCVCKILINGSVKYQFTGNCGYNIPLSQVSNTSGVMKTIGGAISTALAITGAGAVSSVVSTATTSSTKVNYSRTGEKKPTSMTRSEEETTTTTKPLVSGSSAVKEVLGNFSNMGSGVHKGGQLSSNTGYLGVTTPYLEIVRPSVDIPENFARYNGFPCNKYLSLENLVGFTMVDEIILSGFSCTEQELEEIEMLLKGGVIL